jgi:hypothetical protein
LHICYTSTWCSTIKGFTSIFTSPDIIQLWAFFIIWRPSFVVLAHLSILIFFYCRTGMKRFRHAEKKRKKKGFLPWSIVVILTFKCVKKQDTFFKTFLFVNQIQMNILGSLVFKSLIKLYLAIGWPAFS